jgi:DNA-binding CsgD family transcriptional regulator
MRIARVTAVGMVVEADRAQRARDLREKADERDAVARARIHMDRLKAAAEDGGPVERAWVAMGNAEMTRARGRSDADRWLAAASEWDALDRPYWVAIARWRAAEALVDGGDRTAAAEAARPALETARRLGSAWLTAQLTGLASRARLNLEAERDGDGMPAETENGNPFGLTPRERQVLALLAEGATNRQIGTALYMAEKTASVHVSRILSKLGVSTRTQAAAVAHRQHLD